MCQLLKVSKSAYYGWLNHKPTKREMIKARHTRAIRDIFFSSRRTYGSPKVYTMMRKISYTISKNQVAAIMRKAGLRSVVKKKHKVPARLMAIKNRPVMRELIFHSDRGIMLLPKAFSRI